jgi:N-acetylmuramoyl-L-alanine amidase
MSIIQRPSPNFDARDNQSVDMLVLHYTGMKTAQEALDRLCDPAAKVSAHYVIDEDGTTHQLVDESNRAWHAGISEWRGHTNINQRSIGIEIVNPGHEFGYRPFPSGQMESVAALCALILTRHAIPARNVVAHSDIAPARKDDPGELFDWEYLSQQGIGLWPQWNGAITPARAEKLADYGYDFTDPAKTITAFQRRFRPQALSGEWDKECGHLLASLLALL